jgi:outer membrane immunogenic protein
MNRISLTLLAGVAALSMASAAQSADLLIQQPAMQGFVDMGGGSGGWDGAYIGGFVGYGFGTASQDAADALFAIDDELDLSGWTLGATLGANFTVGGGLVLGAAGDIAWAGLGGYEDVNGVDFDVNWTGSVRGRAGFDAGAFMPYVTGGLAFAGATASDNGTDNTQTHFGWTAGAGVEVAVVDNISLDLQYRYTDYGTADYDLPVNDATIDLNTHAVTAGVNFKF